MRGPFFTKARMCKLVRVPVWAYLPVHSTFQLSQWHAPQQPATSDLGYFASGVGRTIITLGSTLKWQRRVRVHVGSSGPVPARPAQSRRQWRLGLWLPRFDGDSDSDGRRGRAGGDKGPSAPICARTRVPCAAAAAPWAPGGQWTRLLSTVLSLSVVAWGVSGGQTKPM